MALIAASAATVSACSTSNPEPTVRTVLVQPSVPASARVRCSRPVTLPDRDLSQAEVTTFWGRDRAALVECETRRSAAVMSGEVR